MHTFRHHYPKYLIEAAGLGLFMISASVMTALVEHPASSIRKSSLIQFYVDSLLVWQWG